MAAVRCLKCRYWKYDDEICADCRAKAAKPVPWMRQEPYLSLYRLQYQVTSARLALRQIADGDGAPAITAEVALRELAEANTILPPDTSDQGD